MKALYEEIIDEISTQTLARYKLNIFDTTSYAKSVEATRMRLDVEEIYASSRVANKAEKTDTTSHGFLFEGLDTGMQNIENAGRGSDERYIRHDKMGKSNDELIDVAKIDKSDVIRAENGEAVKIKGGAQLKSFESKESQMKHKARTKVISKSNSLKGENGKYMNADNLDIIVNSDRYDEDINHYKNVIAKSKDQKQIAEAKKMLEKIKQGKVDYETSQNINAAKFAFMSDAKYMVQNIGGVTLSASSMIALQTLGSGVIYEIRDYAKGGTEGLKDRIIRLFENTLSTFKDGFKSSFGSGLLDALVNLVASAFKNLSTKIMYIWENLRTVAKSIYNAIAAYVKGEIKSFGELIVVATKATFSALMVVASVAIEESLFAYLSGILSPALARFLSGIFTIILCAVAVVIGTKTIETSLKSIFVIYADLVKSREKRAEISAVVSEYLPQILKDNERISAMINDKFRLLNSSLNSSFANLQNAINSGDHSAYINSLVSINSAFGKELKYAKFDDFDRAMRSDEPLEF